MAVSFPGRQDAHPTPIHFLIQQRHLKSDRRSRSVTYGQSHFRSPWTIRDRVA
ncbi:MULTISPECIES: hypothetical protein [unclassified Moorena]|uniref:hypothetical protein n=1 Tax=unclassified Moorena TaxID=2683338 RepID=UPI0013CA279E|nr:MULTISPECIES: hypothetical protein [unclassified Moorena]NEO17950.1 hypothetical protein [Moorena sp. SIO4A5]NEQ56284.1 hypothetical protein [Moorena sp. SIO4A1]